MLKWLFPAMSFAIPLGSLLLQFIIPGYPKYIFLGYVLLLWVLWNLGIRNNASPWRTIAPFVFVIAASASPIEVVPASLRSAGVSSLTSYLLRLGLYGIEMLAARWLYRRFVNKA